MSITYTSAGSSHHRYRVPIQCNGRTFVARLTADLRKRDAQRCLLLVDMSAMEVPFQYRSAFAQFVSDLERLDAHKMSAAKKAVLEIMSGAWRDDRRRVAVHKMGPVPVFLMEEYTFSVFTASGEEPRLATVAAYPRDWTASGDAEHFTDEDLFHSLRATDAYVVLTTYFEDIAQHLRDVSDHLNLIECMRRIKEVRELLSQSVSKKLSVLTPSTDEWAKWQELTRGRQLDPTDKLLRKFRESNAGIVCDWFQSGHRVVAEAIYLACVADFCVTEFLALLGLKFNKQEPVVEVKGLAIADADDGLQQFAGRYDLAEFSVLSDRVTVIADLLEEYKFFGLDQASIARLQDADVVDEVTECIRDFLVFLKIAQNEMARIFGSSTDPDRAPVLFVSRRSESRYGKLVADALTEAANAVSAGRYRVTTFQGVGGEPTPPSVKAQLFLSDAVWSVVPGHDESEDVRSDLSWIYREAEHSVVLGKPLFATASSRDNLRAAARRMAGMQEPMLADHYNGSREKKRRQTIERFSDYVGIVAGDREQLVAQLTRVLTRNDIAERRRRILFASYLKMFAVNDLQLFRELVELQRRGLLPTPFTKSNVRTELAKKGLRLAQSQLANAVSRSKKFALAFGDVQRTIIAKDGSASYRCEIFDTMRALSGEAYLSDSVIATDVQAAIEMSLGRLHAKPMARLPDGRQSTPQSGELGQRNTAGPEAGKSRGDRNAAGT